MSAATIRRTINEGSGFALTLRHIDADEGLMAPTTLRWRLDDIAHGRTLIDWTAIETPSSANAITITGAQNTLMNGGNEFELRQVIIEATIDGITAVDEFTYQIRRLQGVTSA